MRYLHFLFWKRKNYYFYYYNQQFTNGYFHGIFEREWSNLFSFVKKKSSIIIHIMINHIWIIVVLKYKLIIIKVKLWCKFELLYQKTKKNMWMRGKEAFSLVIYKENMCLRKIPNFSKGWRADDFDYDHL